MKVGVYAGSFNPFHRGHYDILVKAEKIFDKVIVARGINPEKTNELLPLPNTIMENLPTVVLLIGVFMGIGAFVNVIRGINGEGGIQQ